MEQTGSTTSSRLVLWLLPDLSVNQSLTTLIHELAAQYDGNPFPPHMTLLGPFDGGTEELSARSATLASMLKPLTVKPQSIGGEESRFRCLYVAFPATSKLLDIRRKAETTFGMAGGPFLPHLSLYYGTLPATEKKRLQAGLVSRIPEMITFDTLSLVDVSGPIETWDPAAVLLQPLN